MKKIILAFVVIILVSCQQGPKKSSDETLANPVSSAKTDAGLTSGFLNKYPLLTLLRKTPVEIGCILEKEFNYRDAVFNCDYKNYVNKGDPCKNTTAYYEGLKIPSNLIKKIHPSFGEINLDFEHGNLREISITFADSISISAAKQIFKFPAAKSNFPANVTEINYGENIFAKGKPKDPNYTKWITITGFDHIGAAEAGCQ